VHSEKNKIEALRKSGLFRNVDYKVLAALANVVDIVKSPKDDLLMKAGTIGYGMYFIIEGYLEVAINGNQIAKLGPGDIVGELSLLMPIARTADVTSITDSILYRLRRKEFLVLLEHRPIIGMNALRVLAERIVHLNQQLTENTEKLHLWETRL